MSSILQHARLYATLGFSPIPLLPRSKRPSIDSWLPWVNDVPPPSLLDEWFATGDQNVGIIMRQQYIVVDFDAVPHYLLWQLHNESIAKTYTVRSARGFHAYYRVCEKPEKTMLLTVGELKATGYVVAPPSVHPSGHIYAPYRHCDILTIDSWLDLGVEERKPITSITAPARRSRPGLRTSDKIKNRISVVEYLMRITDVYEGRQPNTWIARCPFHDDRRPSMIVDSEYAYCFRPDCIAHRQIDVINAYAYWNRLDNREAIYQLASALL